MAVGQKPQIPGDRRLERRIAKAKADNPGQAAVDFFPKYLKHVRGEWGGTPFALAGWQADMTRKLFGTLDAEGRRVYRRCVCMIPRKQGKSTYAAGAALYLLLEGEPGAEVYTCAVDRGQARVVHNIAKAMVTRSPQLSRVLKVYRDAIVNPRTEATLIPLSADAASHLGKNSHGLVFDEFAYLPNRDFWDTMHTSMGARREPLSIAISTAGLFDPEGFGWNTYDYARRVEAGEVDDPELLPVLYGLDIDDDWTDPKNWRRANPMMDVTVPMSFYRREFKRAEESVSEQNAKRRLYLNQWVHQLTRWLDMRAWAKCSAAPEIEPGQKCFGGLDLGSTKDLTALVFVFPYQDASGADCYDVMARFYMPEATAIIRERSDNVPYRQWAEDGLVTLTPGDSTDYEFVREDAAKCAALYDVHEIAFDRWGAAKLSNDLRDDGHNIIEFGQGYASMTGPTKELERLVLAGRLRHGGNRLLSWNAGNATAQSDAHENVKLVKDKSTGRIDGMIALIMALARAGAAVDTVSVYQTRGMRSLPGS